MCNPNSSALAYRRQRAMALASSHLEPTRRVKPRDNSLSECLTASLLLQSNGTQSYNTTGQNDVTIQFSQPPTTESSFTKGEYFSGIPTSLVSLQYSSASANSSDTLKSKPKRRRKPQKPGKTAKQNDRHFVVHNYHDHANDADDNEVEDSEGGRRRGGVSVSFPQKLHSVLDQVERDGLAHVVAWQPHGRCFVIHKPKEFTEHVMPHYFRQSKLTSFQRQLNLYGFNRITRGTDAGGYYHELFLRGKEFLCKRMMRTKVKGTKFKAASSPDQEPDFYTMPPVTVTPASSDCDDSDNGQIGDYEQNYSANMYITQEPTYPPAIGNPERYASYQIPVSSPSCRRPLDIPNVSPLAYPPSSNLLSSGVMRTPTFEVLQESPRPTIAAPHSYDLMLGHGVLDQAVDELFLGEGGVPTSEVKDSIVDFVNCWDPSSYGPDAALDNDTQLGNLLDKLLWDEI